MRVIGRTGHLEFTGLIFTAKRVLIVYSSSTYVNVILVHQYFLYHRYLQWFEAYVNQNYFTRYSAVRNLSAPLIRTSHSRQSIDYPGSTLLNSLPDQLKHIENPFTFKINLKNYFLQRRNDVKAL